MNAVNEQRERSERNFERRQLRNCERVKRVTFQWRQPCNQSERSERIRGSASNQRCVMGRQSVKPPKTIFFDFDVW